jgi:hypothetical protein
MTGLSGAPGAKNHRKQEQRIALVLGLVLLSACRDTQPSQGEEPMPQDRRQPSGLEKGGESTVAGLDCSLVLVRSGSSCTRIS